MARCILKIVRKPGDGAKLLNSAIKDIDASIVKVGWPEKKYYPVTKEHPKPITVAYAASINEFGYPSGGIPPRLGMRTTIDKQRTHWAKVAYKQARKILKGMSTTVQALGILGSVAEGDFKETITQVTSPALKPATIAARLKKYADKKTVGNLTKPLIDTGYMLATLTHLVEKKK